MFDTLSITEVKMLLGTTRQNIEHHIKSGNLTATRKKYLTNGEWHIQPENVIQLANAKYKGLMSHLGVYLFAASLNKIGMMTDEKLTEIGNACKTEIEILEKIDIFQPIIANIIATNPIIQQLLQDETHAA